MRRRSDAAAPHAAGSARSQAATASECAQERVERRDLAAENAALREENVVLNREPQDSGSP